MPSHVTVAFLFGRYGQEHVTRCMASWLRGTGHGPVSSMEAAGRVLQYWVKGNVVLAPSHPLVTICAQRRNLGK